MTMVNNDPVALAAREWTRATCPERPFVPVEAPAGTSRTFSMFGQTWHYNAIREDGRVTRTGDVLSVRCLSSDHLSESDAEHDKVRAEIGRYPRGANDSLIWYGFGFRLENITWPFDGWMIILQTHQTAKIDGVVPGEPVFNLQLSPSEPRVNIVRCTQDPGAPDESVFEILASFDIVPGRWHSFVAKAQFSGGGGGGWAKCWVDGTVVLDTATLPDWDGVLAYPHASTLCPKIGTYRHETVAAETLVSFRNPEIQIGHGLLNEEYAGYS